MLQTLQQAAEHWMQQQCRQPASPCQQPQRHGQRSAAKTRAAGRFGGRRVSPLVGWLKQARSAGQAGSPARGCSACAEAAQLIGDLLLEEEGMQAAAAEVTHRAAAASASQPAPGAEPFRTPCQQQQQGSAEPTPATAEVAAVAETAAAATAGELPGAVAGALGAAPRPGPGPVDLMLLEQCREGR